MCPQTCPHRHRRLQEEPAFVATQTSDVLACLLPDATTLHLDACHIDTTAAQITLLVYYVHSVLYRRGVSTAVTNGPWPICRGRSTTCAYSYASASGFAAIATAV